MSQINKTNKTYLGDSVYCENEGFMLKVYTDNGFGPKDVIYLEPEVFQALITFGCKTWDIKPEICEKDTP